MNLAAILVQLAPPLSVVLAAAIAASAAKWRATRGVRERPSELSLERNARRRLRDGWRGYHARVVDGGSTRLNPEERELLYPETIS